MANDIFDWSATAASNTSCDSISTATGMSPGNVDNVFRSLMRIVRNSFSSALQTFLAGTAALPIANGGTAATSASAALTSLGALSSSYRDLPLTTKSAAFTFADSRARREDQLHRGGAYGDDQPQRLDLDYRRRNLCDPQCRVRGDYRHARGWRHAQGQRRNLERQRDHCHRGSWHAYSLGHDDWTISGSGVS
jgi:hypothetical protein